MTNRRIIETRMIGKMTVPEKPRHPVRYGSNPFSTCYTEPGALEYLFPPGLNAAMLVERFIENGGRGQIVAPHGSGKSTLLQTLLPLLKKRFEFVDVETLHDGCRRLGKLFWSIPSRKNRLAVIDGYEQLALLERWRVRRMRHLLVTVHRPVRGLPVLLHDPLTADRFLQLVRRLGHAHDFSNAPAILENEAALTDLFRRHQGNARNAFFELYDHVDGDILS